ncbi:leucine-rich repeat-containing G-protein coupled receptor 4-like [Sitodiplosis mosellana]|uniref:leucine-rich repeat-containing G-protein coupled receptor 4-like n=1 Tax=Sitodiplosis mosellana TaxID=263140 RepID=UPI002444311B|nr:leucine-rich repeat-containing G-protein coupled receptor 4-like [Sitodiplosis mosellana]
MGARQKTLISILLSMFVIHVASGFECEVRDFQNYTDSIKGCDDAKVLTFNVKLWSTPPKDLLNQTRNIHSIDVSGQSLKAIDNKGLCDWPYIKFIFAEENNITSLPSQALAGCHLLNTLSLSKNNISEIYDDAFHGLSLLTNLNLSNNQITSLSGNVFKPLTSLKTLRLNNNQMQAIDTDHFENNRKLEILDLSYNQIIAIDHGSFWKLKKLLTLDLSYNPGLNSLDLSEMDRLHDVIVNGASLTYLRIPTYVVNVFANNNNITQLKIDPNGSLEELCLSYNALRNISDLSPATQLTNLDISYNNITDIDFSYLMSTQIQRIDVLENPIKTFNVQALTSLPAIKSIEITTSNLDNRTLTVLITETNRLNIRLRDPNRDKERKTSMTMPPVTPVGPVTLSTPTTISTTTAKLTPAPTLAPKTTAVPSIQKPTPTHAPTPSAPTNSKDGMNNDMLRRIQNLESTIESHIKTEPNESSAPNQHTEMAESVANLRVLIICTMVAFTMFVSCQLAVFVNSNYRRWRILMPNFFPIRHNGLANNRRTQLNGSMDPMVEDVL